MAGGSGCILGLLMIFTRLVASTVLDLVIGSRQSLMKLAGRDSVVINLMSVIRGPFGL